MTEHSPGPREVDSHGVVSAWHLGRFQAIAQPLLDQFCTPAESEANAQLMAASPDLLTACKFVLHNADRLIEEFGEQVKIPQWLHEWRDMCQEAVCKAEGHQSC